MSDTRIYKSAHLELRTEEGTVTARLHGRYFATFLDFADGTKRSVSGTACKTFELNPDTVLEEYGQRYRRERRRHREYSYGDAEAASLLRWVNELETPPGLGHRLRLWLLDKLREYEDV